MKWKRKTFKRDRMCLCCGEENKEVLTIHHILPKSLYPELIAEPRNLVCLCVDCHAYLHKHVCNNDLHECNKVALEKLYELKGTKKGHNGRRKAHQRIW